MTGTQVAVIPQGIQLPAHLQTADVAAAIAKFNAAAAGGIKIGGFPRISIKGGKFHEVDGGETRTYLQPAAPGQPALPLMLLEAVIAAANPALVKTFYEGEYAPGDDREPTCSSDNGIVPDAHIVKKQNATCIDCPQNQWGSKISKASGKEVKACSDNKRLVIIPVADLSYKALALNVTPSSLSDWGKYVKALSDRNIPINGIVTNITFDATASHPKLLFSFNRLLTAEEYAKVNQRVLGDDVKNIVSPARQIAVSPTPVSPSPVPALPEPPPLGEPAPKVAGFGAVPPALPEKPKRAPRKAAEAPAPVAPVDPLAHLSPGLRAAVAAMGVDSVEGKAILAQFPAPKTAAPATTAPELGAPATTAPVAATPVAAVTGFGTPAPAGAPSPTAPSSVAVSLKEKLQALLATNAAK